ncbi:CHC2 zinc finger domain-containing protein [Flavobacterium sp.]|uniref:CHC2 zinc finger domain-containing protein n=1 Tax=Flavobacterium sp. TaxID=239 RepID=UPI00286E4FE9|nr:CHC2 zinc finger domain-containing protein [Flavobacterium sp.]
MEISEIKQNLSLSQILSHYGLKPKNNMLNCPFHEDKTASLQVNLEKHFYKCHACGAKGDQIQWVQDYEKITKHEAIIKCEQLANSQEPVVWETKKTTEISQLQKVTFLEIMLKSFRKGLVNSTPAREYCKKRNLEYSKIEIGFNSGQFHHGERKSEELINNSLAVGLLLDNGLKSNNGETAYNVFGKYSLVFALKNKENGIVSFYFRSILDKENAKHFYLKNRSGLYPNYPNPATKKLILTESIIDCASLLQIDEIAKNHSVLACYGTNGLNEEIQKAILELTELEEIIFAFDNDQAGKEAVKKYANQLRIINEKLKISTVELPNKDINETLQLHENEIFTELLEQRKEVPFLFLIEDFSIENLSQKLLEIESLDDVKPIVKGENISEKIANKQQPRAISQEPIPFLKTKELLKRLNVQIGKSGIVGEENSRLLLFLIIISYMNKSPIHAIVQGSSGSGKTHIISRIADLMPGEDVLRFTRITESSLYNWGEFDLFRKIIIIEDLDGLKEDALYALRELISNQFLSSSVSMKDKKGNNKSTRKEVKGQFSSLSATTKGETYEDNMSRSFLIAVDESKEQTQRIIENQNKRNAGEIDPKESQKAVQFIQAMVRNLKHYEVINPFATKLQLPEKVHKIRRLNEMYQAVIKQVTFLNQYQRQLTKDNQLITEIEDIEQATEILFESIILKVDELDGSLRQFFERLKKYVKDKENIFTQREIRQEMNISKTQLQRFINSLLELEYIKYKGGFSNKGLKYQVDYWDNYSKIRTEIKTFLVQQIEQLKPNKV